jgi:hypothetical protein
VLPELGLISLCRVALYRLGLKSGHYRRALPIKEYDAALGLIFHPGSTNGQKIEASELLLKDAEAMLSGELLLFSHFTYRFKNYPDWHFDPINQTSCRKDLHWTQTEVPDTSDIKCLWEMSRYEWAPTLARAWCVTGKDRYLEVLNNFTNNWLEQNPLNQGVNWKCGQETSIRLINILLTWWLLGKGPKENLASIVVDHLTRINKTLTYAIAQNNNHGISEAAALFIGGGWLVAHGQSENQRQLGIQCVETGSYWLENRVGTLIFDDGGFSQYSANYHRVLLDSLSQVEFWRLELNQPVFSDSFYIKARAAITWLLSIMVIDTGHVANLGANDGAQLYSLNESNYDDFRPSLQLLSVLLNGAKLFDDTACDASLDWLGLNNEIPISKVKVPSVVLSDSGIVAMRSGHCLAVVKLSNSKFRPSHSDCLHLDLFLRNENLLRDSGSYSYQDFPWHNYFSGTSAHNTIEFDKHDQMPKLSKFLFARWLTNERVGEISVDQSGECWSGSYADSWGNFHERSVKISAAELVVADTIRGDFSNATLRWRLMPGEWAIENNIVTAKSVTIEVTSDSKSGFCELVSGWESRRYQKKEPIPVLKVEFPAGAQKIRTRISLK